jgi:hypothetical protein
VACIVHLILDTGIKYLFRKYGRKITWKTETYVDDRVKIDFKEISWEN